MKVYTAHVRRHGLDPERDFVLVKEGFNWPAFLLTSIWALYHRLWLAAFALIATQFGIAALVAWSGANPASGLIVDLLIAVLAGMAGNDLRRRRLARQGFDDLGVVTGQSLRDAERRFLDQNPMLTDMIAEGLGE